MRGEPIIPRAIDAVPSRQNAQHPTIRPNEHGLAIETEIRYDLLAMAKVQSQAGRVRAKVSRAKPGTLFAVADFEGPRGAVETALSRLEHRGELRRVRKGLYFKGVRSRFGSGKPREEDIVYKVCGRKGVGPAGWSAGRVLGLTTQVPARPEFAVLGAAPTGISGVGFHSRKNLARIELNPREIAVLEVLRVWPMAGEASWIELVDRVRELHDEGAINLERLRKVASRERSPGLRQRMTALASDR